ncbi:ANR16 protein, partial [Mionectes macconnelli]|nr:ANR16 protein [Mionectes macconnelli]
RRRRRLLRLVREGKLELLRDELHPEDIPEARGDTLLHLGARLGHLALLEFLLRELGMDPEVADGDYKRPLHEAASMGHEGCVSFLLESGASVDCLKKGDWTPLMMACTRKNLEVIRCLVEHGANPLLRNKDGWNCFHIASREGHPEVLRYLLEVSPGIWDTESTVRRTPLHTAAASSSVLAFFFSSPRCHYQPDSRDTCGVTPFMDAIQNGHLDIARMLLEKHQACPTATDALGAQALHRAAQSLPSQAIPCLHDSMSSCAEGREDVPRPDPGFPVPLQEGHGHTIQTLLALGADIQAKDGKSRSALHAAAAGQRAEATRILLRAGLRDTMDSSGTLAQQLARKPEVIQVFQESQVTA